MGLLLINSAQVSMQENFFAQTRIINNDIIHFVLLRQLSLQPIQLHRVQPRYLG